MIRTKLLILVVFLLAFVVNVINNEAIATQTIDLKDFNANINITDKVEHVAGFGDAEWPWDVPVEQWHLYELDTYQFLMSGDFHTYDHWFRFRVHNRSGDSQDILVSINNHFLNKVDVFVKNAHGALERVWHTGLERGLGSKPYPSGVFSFPIHINNHDSKTIYIKTKSNFNAQLNFTLQNVSVFSKYDAIEKISNGVMTGLVALASIYCLIMLVFMHETRFLNYFILTFAIVVSLLLTGSYMTLLADITSSVNILKLFLSSNYLLLLGLLLSSSEYIAMVAKNLNRLVKAVFSVFLIIGAVVSWFTPTYYSLLLIVSCFMVMIFWTLLMLVICLKSRNMINLSILFSIIVFLVGCIIPCLCLLGVLNGVFYAQLSFIVIALPICGVITLSIGYRIYKEKAKNLKVTRQANFTKKKYVQLYKLTKEGMFIANEDGELKSGNPAICNLLGFTDKTELRDVGIVRAREICAEHSEYDALISELYTAQDEARKSGKVQDIEKVVITKNIRVQTKDKTKLVAMSVRMNEDSDGANYVIGELKDLSTDEDYEKQLNYITYHDDLTGACNRKYLFTQLDRIFKKEVVDKDAPNKDFLCLIKVASLKYISDEVSHEMSNRYLKTVVDCFKQNLPEKYNLVRLSNDEFAVIFEECYQTTLTSILRRCRGAISSLRFSNRNEIYSIASNYGIVDVNIAGKNVSALMSCADAVCKKSIQNGSNQILLWCDTQKNLFNEINNRDISLLSRYLHELEHVTEDLHICSQKIGSFNNNAEKPIAEFFTVLRSSNGEITVTGDVINKLKGFNIIYKLDIWLIRQVFFAFSNQNSQMLNNVNRIFLKVHGETICDLEAKDEILEMIKMNPDIAKHLCILINKQELEGKIDFIKNFMDKYSPYGVQYVLDEYDGGEAYTYLQKLPFSYVRLGKAYSNNVDTNKVNQVIAKFTASMFREMDIKVCASGVSNSKEYKILHDYGFDYCQGDYISKVEFLRKNR